MSDTVNQGRFYINTTVDPGEKIVINVDPSVFFLMGAVTLNSSYGRYIVDGTEQDYTAYLYFEYSDGEKATKEGYYLNDNFSTNPYSAKDEEYWQYRQRILPQDSTGELATKVVITAPNGELVSAASLELEFYYFDDYPNARLTGSLPAHDPG